MTTVVLGFPGSAVTADCVSMLEQAGHTVVVQSPPNFLAGNFDRESEYIITVTRELELRQALGERIDQENLKRATFVHHSCWVDPTAVIEPGCFISPFCTIASRTVISKDCYFAPYCLVGHVTTVGRYCLFTPTVAIAGGCNIGERCRFGIRSAVIDYIDIASDCEIGASALVTKSIAESGKYVGSPARRVK